MELFKGLEEARQKFNGYQGRARIYIDVSDMTAWCHVLDTPEYHDETIYRLVGKDDLYGRNARYSYEKLESAARKKLAMHREGWEKWLIDDDYHVAEILH